MRLELNIGLEKTDLMRVIELFSGIGAYAKALKRLGIKHEIVAAIELDAKTMDCYNIIHNSDFKPMDVTKIVPEELPDCDLICYSPPCQAFSTAGHQKGFEDKRGILFFDALKIIKAKMPKYCIMENVKGLTQKKFANEFAQMLAGLEEAGYINYYKILNAKDFGIPQNRERVFVVSIRKDINSGLEF